MKKIILLLIMISFGIVLSGCTEKENISINQLQKEQKIPQGIEEECQKIGGRWLSEFQECLCNDEQWCTDKGGVFNKCASRCRHSKNKDSMCTMECIQVCTF